MAHNLLGSGSSEKGTLIVPQKGVSSALHRYSRVFFLMPLFLLFLIFRESLLQLLERWMTDENFSHGIFVPLVSFYLIWDRRGSLVDQPVHGTWWGLALMIFGLGLYLLGELTTLYVLLYLSFWLTLVGMVIAYFGLSAAREIVFPLLYLLTMIPLPHFLIQSLSGQLQLISSKLGVGCLQLVGVTAFREGNVIDLGPLQLQVVEACSGLRYVFPLMSLALLCAYLYHASFWKRLTVFLSSIPISIGLNGFRIGMIGLLVDHYGQGLAEGFYHFFEGWILFVASLGLLFVEMWLLAKIGSASQGRSFLENFHVQRLPSKGDGGSWSHSPKQPVSRLSPAYLCSMVLLAPVLVASTQIRSNDEIVPVRESFLDFPMTIGEWTGNSFPMEKIYVDVLRFDDYLLADYRNRELSSTPVNLYVAYYKSQRKGQSAHSPRTCIPGGGWEIVSLEEQMLPVRHGGYETPLFVNRVFIQKGENKQVVYYWFQQRGRNLTNEYLVKWYLFWDALTRNRTDGALVRLTLPLNPGESVSQADEKLMAFAGEMYPFLEHYVPN